MADQGQLLVDIGVDIKNLQEGFAKAMTEIKSFAKKAGDEGEKVKTTFGKITEGLDKGKVVFAAISGAITGVGVAALFAQDKVDNWQDSFTALLGSGKKADQMFQNLSSTFANTPLEIGGVMDAAKQMMSFGVETQKIVPLMTQMGDVAAGLGIPIEGMAEAFGRVAVTGELTNRQLVSLSSQGVPIMDALAQALGKTKAQIQDMADKGKLGMKDLEKAFQTMAGQGGQFFGQMSKQSADWSAMMTIMKNNIFLLGAELGNILLPIAQKVLGLLTIAINFLRQLSPETKQMIVIIAGIVAAIAGVLAGLGSLVALWPAIAAIFTGALTALGAIASAIFSIPALIIGLVAVLTMFATNFLGFRDIVIQVLSGLMQAISTFGSAVQLFFQGKFKEAAATAGQAFTGAWTTIKTGAMDMGANVMAKFDEIKDKYLGTKQAMVDGDIATNAVIQTEEEKLAAARLARTDAQMKAWIRAKQEEVAANQKAMDFMSVSQENFFTQAKGWTNNFVDGFGRGFAQMVMEGKKFSDVMKGLWKNMASEIISWIARIIVKWLVLQAMTGGKAGTIASMFGGGMQKGGWITEPSIVTGLRSGEVRTAGEAGPEAVVPLQDLNAMKSGNGGGGGDGGGLSVQVNISGQFIEGNEASWQALIRDRIVPEIRRFTMSTPVGPFTRRRGAVA